MVTAYHKTGHVHKINPIPGPVDRAKLKTLIERAKRNDNPSRALLKELFASPSSPAFIGEEFVQSFLYALDILRKYSGQRETGHASITHSLRLVLSLFGWTNSYGLAEKEGRSFVPIGDIVAPSHLIALKGEDYLKIAACAAILHDLLEDSSKSAAQIEERLAELEKKLTQIGGAEFAQQVCKFVYLLTNKYDRVQKMAQRQVANGSSPIKSVEGALRAVRKELVADGLQSYVKMADELLSDVEKMDAMADSLPSRLHGSYGSRMGSTKRLFDWLSFKAYAHYSRDLLYACIENFSSHETSDIPLLVKWLDGKDNIATMNFSNREKILRALAKAEIVVRRIDSRENRYANLRDVAFIPDDIKGWIRYLYERDDVNKDYLAIWQALALDLKCLMVRACIQRAEMLAKADEPSVAGEMGPFLAEMESKYRSIYVLDERHGFIRLLRKNPIGGLWIRKPQEYL